MDKEGIKLIFFGLILPHNGILYSTTPNILKCLGKMQVTIVR